MKNLKLSEMKEKISTQQENNPERNFQEIEFKFVAPSDAIFDEIEKLEKIGEFNILEKKTIDVKNSYLDTPDQDLKKNKALLRIRKRSDGEITVDFKKKIEQKDNLFSREEVIAYVSQEDLDQIENLDIEPLERVRKIIGNKKLQESPYKNKNRRTILNLSREKNGPIEIEMVLDRVTFIKGEKESAPFYEIEAENKGISQEELKEFADILESQYNLEPSTMGKRKRGEQVFEIKPEKYNLKKGIEKIKDRIEKLTEEIERPVIVSVAGGSASGKTSKVAKRINELFPDSQILSLDDYYKGKEFMRKIGSDNWDEPRALGLDLFKQHLQELKQNKKIKKPIYSVKTGERTGYEYFSPSKILITEGLFALNQKLIDESDLSIFVEIGVHGRLLRRLMRDIKRTGQSEEEILKMYTETVHPMHELHIEPTKDRASLIIVNEYDPTKEAERSEKYEIQIKIPINDIDTVKKQIENKLKAKKIETQWQQDTYFEAPGWNLPKTDELMRIRQEGENYTLAYKGPTKGKEIRIKPKIEFSIDPDLKDVLEKIGYKKILNVNKKREKYVSKDIELTLDEVENLGNFIELRTDNPKDKKKINTLVKKLWLEPKSATKKSYFELMFENRGMA